MERNYESMMVMRSDLEDSELEGIFNKVSKKIEDLGGKVGQAKVWARQRSFAYPLRSKGAEKKRFNKGCYWLIDFYLDTKSLGDLKETIRLEENILRNIIIKIEKKDK